MSRSSRGRRAGRRSERITIRTAEANVEVDDDRLPAARAGRRWSAGSPASPNPPAPSVVPPASKRRGAGAVDRRRRPLRPRRAQHRLGDDERPHLGGRRAQRGAARRSCSSARRAAACGARSTAARRSSRSSTRARCSRSARSPSTRPTRSTVWVGTGETLDAQLRVDRRRHLQVDRRRRRRGRTMGLPESERIARIVVDPKNGDVVYACVPGKLWSDSAERGVYKTTDGGKTWSARAQGREPVDRLLRPRDGPEEPGGALRRPVGLPPQGLDVPLGRRRARRAERQRRCCAPPTAGKTWTPAHRRGERRACRRGRGAASRWRSRRPTPRSSTRSSSRRTRRSTAPTTAAAPGRRATRARCMVWRPFYFARLVVDPTNPDRVFKPDLDLIVSEDGGRSFARRGGGSHGDWHDLWIDPDNPKHVIGGDDGGLWISYDGGNRWWKANNLPISQFYHVSVDDKDPYQVYGGLQDNSSLGRRLGRARAASRTRSGRTSTAATASGRSSTRPTPTPSTPSRRAATSAASTARTRRRPRHPAEGRLQREAALQLEHADPREPDAEGHDLHRRAVPLPLARPRRHLGAHLARPDDERPGEAEAGGVGRRHGRQLRRPRCTRRSTRSASRRRTRR